MAHDEGYYAQQARWILATGDWYTPQWWGEPVYDRTIGMQWLMASSFALFGIHEGSARFPSFLACLGSLLLTYQIGTRFLPARVAWLGAAILAVTPIWIQYGRLATQDSTLVFVELLGIWALLSAESADASTAFRWRLLAGITLGIGFLIKGFMVILPVVALLPYLIAEQRRHRHLTQPALYLGLVLGFIPLGIWFWVSWLHYGWLPFQQLFGKLFFLGTQDRYSADPLYYVWNIPLNAFPWPLFTLIGVGFAFNRSIARRSWLLLSYPTLLFLELSLFKTRTPYYPLQILPFMALLAGLGLEHLSQLIGVKSKPSFIERLPGWLSYGFGGLAALLTLAGLWIQVGLAKSWNIPNLQLYGAIALVLGIGWMALPGLWWQRHRLQQVLPIRLLWLGSWLLGVCLALIVVVTHGLFGDYSPEIKAFLQQPEIGAIVQQQPIDFVVREPVDGETHKTWVLLSFYTPHLGEQFSQLAALPTAHYAWISPSLTSDNLASRYQIVGTINQWKLVQVKSQKNE